MQVNINIQELEELNKSLQDAQEQLEDTKPLMLELSNHLYNVVSESFEDQRTPDAISWSPIKKRKADRTPNKILYDSGDMQDSLQSEATSTTATVGLNITANGYPYPIVHQFGSLGGKIKARPFMPIHNDGRLYDKTEKELVKIVEDFIEESLK